MGRCYSRMMDNLVCHSQWRWFVKQRVLPLVLHHSCYNSVRTLHGCLCALNMSMHLADVLHMHRRGLSYRLCPTICGIGMLFHSFRLRTLLGCHISSSIDNTHLSIYLLHASFYQGSCVHMLLVIESPFRLSVSHSSLLLKCPYHSSLFSVIFFIPMVLLISDVFFLTHSTHPTLHPHLLHI